MGSFSGPKVEQNSLYNYHVCTSSGTFTPSFTGNIEVLVVAGGGGGGMDMGGGGGGGGVLTSTSYAVTAATGITVTVGAGGVGAPAGGSLGNNTFHQFTISATQGGNSVFGSLTAIGGGYGGSSYVGYTPNYAQGGAGGSGGGSSGYVGNTGTFGAGTAGQGNKGGYGATYYSGGGGGAGAQGVDAAGQPNGGIGVLNSILGTAYYWGGGGGGASYSLSIGGNGGNGGGGGGGVGYTIGGAGLNSGQPGGGGYAGTQTNCHGGNAGQNTGGGGGGGAHYNSNNHGGNGGSGIVIIRYLKTLGTSTFSNSGPVDMNSLVLSFDAANLGKSSAVEVLVVAGGGGGGMDMGGGGGGGGVIYRNAYSVQNNTPISVTVGAGGAGAPQQYGSNPIAGSTGSNSIFGGLVAFGGGGGGSGHTVPPIGGQLGQIGGCGGGDSARYVDYASLTQGYFRPSFDTTQGYDGGKGTPANGYHAGGGGCAGQPGGGGGNTYAGNGGQGFLSAINGTSFYWGGGGGGADHTSVAGNGGAGGGGGGSLYSGGTAGTGGAGLNAGGNGVVTPSTAGGAGGTNTGGGGGGGSHAYSVGGAGGSGIVIVRYYGSQKATGGTITSSGGYTIHTFTSSGTFTPTGWIGLKDISSGGFTSTVIGSTYSSDNNGVYSFNGSTNRIATNCSLQLTDFTIGVWFKALGNTGGYDRIIDKLYSNGTMLMRNSSASNSWGGGVLESSGPYGRFLTLTDGQWHYLVSIRSGTTHTLYGDGITNTVSGTVSGTALSNIPFGIGSWYDGSAQYFNGQIGQVQVYNRALSADEVLENFNAMRGRYGI